jgi:hypothetical protein
MLNLKYIDNASAEKLLDRLDAVPIGFATNALFVKVVVQAILLVGDELCKVIDIGTRG